MFIDCHLRAEVAGVVLLIGEGLVPLRLIHELFAKRAHRLIDGVRELIPDALHDAYCMLYVEEPAVKRALVNLLGTVSTRATDIHTIDTAHDLVGTATSLEALARSWDQFIHRDESDGL